MAFTIKRRGKVTYYSEGERPVLSALVTEEQPDGDLKIYFSGLTGGYSARGVLGRACAEGPRHWPFCRLLGCCRGRQGGAGPAFLKRR